MCLLRLDLDLITFIYKGKWVFNVLNLPYDNLEPTSGYIDIVGKKISVYMSLKPGKINNFIRPILARDH